MSGGAWENSAAYNNTGGYLTTNGWPDLTPETPSSRYATRYYNKTGTSYIGTTIYQVGKTGDSTKETYLGTGYYSWYSDYAHFTYAGYPFFERGGYYNGDMSAGVFCSNSAHGYGYSTISFRAVLCVRLALKGDRLVTNFV